MTPACFMTLPRLQRHRGRPLFLHYCGRHRDDDKQRGRPPNFVMRLGGRPFRRWLTCKHDSLAIGLCIDTSTNKHVKRNSYSTQHAYTIRTRIHTRIPPRQQDGTTKIVMGHATCVCDVFMLSTDRVFLRWPTDDRRGYMEAQVCPAKF